MSGDAQARRRVALELVVMRIERASIDDAPRVSWLIRGLSESLFLLPNGEGAGPFLASISEAAIRSYIEAANFSYFVAEDESKLVGVVAMRDNSHLYHLFVEPSLQGKGFARQLWHFIKANAVQAGNLGKFTVNSSLNAVPVYESFGFKVSGPKVEMHGIAFQPMQL